MTVNERDWNITDIETLTELEVIEMAEDCMEIKGHQVYFIDFGGAFKYSALVFRDGAHIYYANDYELHHPGRDREWLHQWYIDTMTDKLFTDDEYSQVTDYNDYRNKNHYLFNYYGMQHPHVSRFGIFRTEEDHKKYRKKVEGMVYDPVAFAYYDPQYTDFIKKHIELLNVLCEAKEKMVDSYEYHKEAFLYEMWNHEYGINWQADYDTLSAFGDITYIDPYGGDDLEQYFNQLGFNDTQRRAYIDARKEYWKKFNEGDD